MTKPLSALTTSMIESSSRSSARSSAGSRASAMLNSASRCTASEAGARLPTRFTSARVGMRAPPWHTSAEAPGRPGPEGDARADPLHHRKALGERIGAAAAAALEPARRLVAQLLDEQRAAGAGRSGDDLRGGQHDAQRAVAVLELAHAEGQHGDPELLLHHSPLDGGGEREKALAIFLQLPAPAALGLLGGDLLARFRLRASLRADGCQLRLGLL